MLEEVNCKRCNGKGQILLDRGYGANREVGMRSCPKCGGRGVVIRGKRVSTPPPMPTLFGEVK